MNTQYARPERMPFFLIESAYEHEHEASEQRLRTQAYQAVLSGAAGQVFGNNPIWHFDGPGIYPAPVTWQEALDSRGAHSMTPPRSVGDHAVVAARARFGPHAATDGLGPEDARAVAASDRRWLHAQQPRDHRRSGAACWSRDRGGLEGWADGNLPLVGGSLLLATGTRRFSDSWGSCDWVLVLESPT
jgi:hypothetical protein